MRQQARNRDLKSFINNSDNYGMSPYTSDPIFPRDAYAICKLPCDPLSIQRLERNQEREKESASIEDPKNVVLHGS